MSGQSLKGEERARLRRNRIDELPPEEKEIVWRAICDAAAALSSALKRADELLGTPLSDAAYMMVASLAVSFAEAALTAAHLNSDEEGDVVLLPFMCELTDLVDGDFFPHLWSSAATFLWLWLRELQREGVRKQ